MFHRWTESRLLIVSISNGPVKSEDSFDEVSNGIFLVKSPTF